MNWVAILIFVVAVAMVFGPLMLMQPSARERAQALLRQKAIEKGMRVRTIPPDPKNGISPQVVYELPWLHESEEVGVADWRLSKQKYAHGIHFFGAWDWDVEATLPESALEGLKSVIERMPDSVTDLGSTPIAVYCCWKEMGGEASLASIYEGLSQLRDLIEASKVVSSIDPPAI